MVSFSISGGMVAEKNSVCRRGGSLAQIFSISGTKPMSSMRSASSMTRISTPLSRMRPRSNWSSRRPGRRDQHVDAAIELLVLVFERHAADDQRHRQAVVLAVFFEVLVHLRRQFARRLENERARHAGAGPAVFQQRQHGQHERCRLAGAGLGNADNVLLLQGHAGWPAPEFRSAWCIRRQQPLRSLCRIGQARKNLRSNSVDPLNGVARSQVRFETFETGLRGRHADRESRQERVRELWSANRTGVQQLQSTEWP